MTVPGAPGGPPGEVRWDFAVSFVEADRGWADWLLWQLQDAGARVVTEPPLAPAGDAAPALAAAARHAQQVLVVLSEDYLAAAGDVSDSAGPGGLQDAAGRLVAVRVTDCRRPGLLSRVVSFDLFGLEPPVARDWLRRQLAVLRPETAAPAPTTVAAPPATAAGPAATAKPAAARPAVAQPPPGVEVLAELSGLPSPVRATVFPATGGLLVTGSQDGRIRLLDLANPARPTIMTEIEYGARFNQEWVRALATSADGTRLAVAGDAMRVAVWDVTDPAAPEQVFSERGHKHYIRAVALRPDAAVLASGGQDKAVVLWDTRRTGRQSVLAVLTDHRKSVEAVAFSQDGRRLASGGSDKTVILWDVADPAHPTRTAVLDAHRDVVHAVAFVSPTLLATASADRVSRLWDVSSPAQPRPVAELTGHRKPVTALAVSGDATRLASGAADGTVALWDIVIPDRPARITAVTSGHGAVNDLAFARDGAMLAAACAGKATVVWSIGTRLASANR